MSLRPRVLLPIVVIGAVLIACGAKATGDFDIARDDDGNVEVIDGQISLQTCSDSFDHLSTSNLTLGPDNGERVAATSSSIDDTSDPPCMNASFPEAALGERSAESREQVLILESDGLRMSENVPVPPAAYESPTPAPAPAPAPAPPPAPAGAWARVADLAPGRVFAAAAGFREAASPSQVVVMGGYDAGTALLADTWVYEAGAWTKDADPGPPARYETAMAAQGLGAAERLVLFGGAGTAAILGDTWMWDGTQWTDATPAGPAVSPPARHGHAMATLSTGEVVVYGGRDTGGALLMDTWLFDGTSWSEVVGADEPGARNYHAMATTTDGKVLLHGGSDGGSTLADTWIFDGAAWTLAEAVSPAGPRVDTAIAPAVVGGDPILAAGSDATHPTASAYRWTGTTWVALPSFPGGVRSGNFGATLKGAGGGLIVGGGGGGVTPAYEDVYQYTP